MSADQQKLTDRTCKYLRSTLLSQKGGVAADQLARDYMDLVGEEIPFRRLSFPSLESFLRSVPEVCQLTRAGRELTVVGVASRDTKHIEEMVAKQNSKGGKKRGGGNKRGGSRSQSCGPTKYRPSVTGESRVGSGRQQGRCYVPSQNHGWGGGSLSHNNFVIQNGWGGSLRNQNGWGGGQGNENGWDSNSISQNGWGGATTNLNGWGRESSQNNWGGASAAQQGVGGGATSYNGWGGGSNANYAHSAGIRMKKTGGNSHASRTANPPLAKNTTQDARDAHSKTASTTVKRPKSAAKLPSTNPSLPETGVTTKLDLAILRVRGLLEVRLHGLFISQVVKMYEKQYGERLSGNWAEQMQKEGVLTVDTSQVCRMVENNVGNKDRLPLTSPNQPTNSFCSDYSLAQDHFRPVKVPLASFPAGPSWNIFVCSVSEHNTIFFQLVCYEQQLQSLFSDMADHYTSSKPPGVNSPVIGNFYCARVGEDFYRVEVVGGIQGNSCPCRLVDLGLKEDVAVTNLLELVPAFQLLPAQALVGTLAGMEEFSHQRTRQLVVDKLEGRSFTVLVVNRSELSSGSNQVKVAPNLLLLDQREGGVVDISAELVKELSALARADTNNNPASLSKAMSHLTLGGLDMRRTIPPACLPKVEEYYDLTVGLVHSPHQFTVQSYSDKPAFLSLSRDMQAFYSDPATANSRQFYDDLMVKGTPLALLQGNCWVRATLDRQMARSELACRLVDSGRLVVCPQSKLLPLLPRFCELPAQAIRARLARVRPTGEVSSGGWCESSVDWFRRTVFGNSYVGLVEDILTEEGEMVLGLELFDTSDQEKDVNINQEMIRRRLAKL